MRRKFKTQVLTPNLGHAASQTPRKETATPRPTLPTRGWGTRAATPFYCPVNYKNGMLINNAYIKTKNRMPSGPPATWRDNMALLESTGFIKTKKIGNHQYRYVLLIHPTAVVEKLKAQKKVDEEWVTAYEARQTETKERSYAQRMKQKKDAEKAAKAAKVLHMKSKNPAQKATA